MRCEILDDEFFVDAFFSIKKDKKSSKGIKCCQLFAATKEIVCVVQIK